MNDRTKYGIALAVSLLSGLALRGAESSLPFFVVRHFGDVIWSLMVYVGVRFLWPELPPMRSAAIAMAFSIAIEFAQLISWPWLVDLRNNTPAKLVLGRSFEWIDMFRYFLGIAIGFFLDEFTRRRRHNS